MNFRTLIEYLGSQFKEALTLGILALKEKNVVQELKDKWWRNPENITCEVSAKLIIFFLSLLLKNYIMYSFYFQQETDKDKNKLGIANVGGVFLLLILGCIFAFFVSILEFLWNVRKVAVREKVSIYFN